MNGGEGKRGFEQELRDKRVAFGVATKLLFRRYADKGKNPIRAKQFWSDVRAFYTAYQQEQELAVSGKGGEVV